MYSRFFVILVLLLGLSGTGAAAQTYERTVHDTLGRGVTSVSVENGYGSIAVTTWNRNAVAYRARIVSSQAQDIVEQTSIKADSGANRLLLGTDYSAIEAAWRLGPKLIGYGKTYPKTHYTLVVPDSTNVSLDGEETRARVVGLAGRLQIDTEGEPLSPGQLITDMLPMEVGTERPVVAVENQQGPARLDVEEGPVTVRNTHHNLAVDLDEGQLTIGGHRGALTLDLEEGRAEVRTDSLDETLLVTDEGRIELTMLQDSGFTLSTELDESAVLEADFNLVPFRTDDGNYRGSVRGGGPLLRVESDEGTVALHAR